MIRALVSWFQANQRSLPWRNSYDPYHVWLSEVMLQQTKVETMLPYYHRFLERFPSLEGFSIAEEDEILSLWSGLGYYNRVRNFHRAAKHVMEAHGGQVPADYETLLSLPGIGRYMAGAIMSIAFNKPYPIVDGNVRRVLSRLHGWKKDNPPETWDAAQNIVQLGEPRLINQAMMELGATICSYRKPQCENCPIRLSCKAYSTGLQENIPATRKRVKATKVQLFSIVDLNSHGVLMRKVDGFWEFPTFDKLPKGAFQQVGKCRHTITHNRIIVDVYRGTLATNSTYIRVKFDKLAVTSLTRKVHSIAKLQE